MDLGALLPPVLLHKMVRAYKSSASVHSSDAPAWHKSPIAFAPVLSTYFCWHVCERKGEAARLRKSQKVGVGAQVRMQRGTARSPGTGRLLTVRITPFAASRDTGRCVTKDEGYFRLAHSCNCSYYFCSVALWLLQPLYSPLCMHSTWVSAALQDGGHLKSCEVGSETQIWPKATFAPAQTYS